MAHGRRVQNFHGLNRKSGVDIRRGINLFFFYVNQPVANSRSRGHSLQVKLSGLFLVQRKLYICLAVAFLWGNRYADTNYEYLARRIRTSLRFFQVFRGSVQTRESDQEDLKVSQVKSGWIRRCSKFHGAGPAFFRACRGPTTLVGRLGPANLYLVSRDPSRSIKSSVDGPCPSPARRI